MPAWTNFSKPSKNGKKASEAATEFTKLSGWNLFIFSIAILQLSNLLGCPEPMPSVDLLLAITIELDLTCLQTLNAKIKLFNWSNVGFFLETILKSFLVNFLISGVWNKIELKFDIKLLIFDTFKLLASINLKFFFFLIF